MTNVTQKIQKMFVLNLVFGTIYRNINSLIVFIAFYVLCLEYFNLR